MRNGDKGGAWRELGDELREFKKAANDLLRRQRDGLRKIESRQ